MAIPGLWGDCWHKPGAEQDPSLQVHAAGTRAGGTLSRAVRGLRDDFLSVLTFQKLKHFQQKKSLEERLFRQGNQGKAICQQEIKDYWSSFCKNMIRNACSNFSGCAPYGCSSAWPAQQPHEIKKKCWISPYPHLHEAGGVCLSLIPLQSYQERRPKGRDRALMSALINQNNNP